MNMAWQGLAVDRLTRVDPEIDDHAGIKGGVLAHENGLFLYKTKHLAHAGRERFGDYLAAGLLGSFMFTSHWFCLLPFLVYCTRLPRQYAFTQFFTHHAELWPHTEQVVFHKSSIFGVITRHIVDIDCLERIDSDEMDHDALWNANVFDDQMIFKDSRSKEVFVFDRNGIWNKDTLEHPLLN